MNKTELLDRALEVAKNAATQAGHLIRSSFSRPMSIVTKSSDVDLVTETDRQSEDLIRTMLEREFPEFIFLGEEEASNDPRVLEQVLLRSRETDAYVWAADPLDGTTNFVCHYPHSCVSIGLVHGGEPVMGVVYNPYRDELFYGRVGGGSYCNGQRLQVDQQVTDLKQALVSANVGSDRSVKGARSCCLMLSKLMLHPVRGIRMHGSCALDLCQLAQGQLTCYLEDIPWPWDTAAGAVILREAGGVIYDFDGGAFNVFSRGLLAANNKQIAEQLVAVHTSKNEPEFFKQ
jgi:fructose-1,6-bisphosphatase/inositol monophosphatase family enzyme